MGNAVVGSPSRPLFQGRLVYLAAFFLFLNFRRSGRSLTAPSVARLGDRPHRRQLGLFYSSISISSIFTPNAAAIFRRVL
jgi:hypothetical protein